MLASVLSQNQPNHLSLPIRCCCKKNSLDHDRTGFSLFRRVFMRNTPPIVRWQLTTKRFQSLKFIWLVVEPTHLKNMIVKMNHLSPKFGVKIPKIFELPPPSYPPSDHCQTELTSKTHPMAPLFEDLGGLGTHIPGTCWVILGRGDIPGYYLLNHLLVSWMKLSAEQNMNGLMNPRIWKQIIELTVAAFTGIMIP